MSVNYLTLNNFTSSDVPVKYGFFGREGGTSTGTYTSLNCALGSGDNPVNILANRDVVARTLGGGVLCTPYQTHSAVCVYVSDPFSVDNRPPADALVTDNKNVIIGVLSADCAPLLMYGIKKNGRPIIGAAHAGWKGALGGVLEATIIQMVDHGADLNTIRVAIGPCITQKSYEVGADFADPFLTRDPADEIFFKPSQKSPDKLYFDLPGYCARRLATCGVRHVTLSDVDTYTHPETYFSYRRSCHLGERDYGRQVAAIRLL